MRRARLLVAAGVVAVLLLLAFRLAWPARFAPLPGTARRTLVVGGRTRTYLLHRPHGWRGTEPLPLVLVFHGHTGDARTVAYESALDAAADRAHVLVVYANGTGPLDRIPLLGGRVDLTWNVGPCCAPASTQHVDDVGFAAAIVRQLAGEHAVDPRRVYATGFSIGGTLALKLACDRAGLVAAAATVEGTMPDTRCAPATGVSVLLVRGGDDDELREDLRENRARPGHRFADSMGAALRFWIAHDRCGPVTASAERGRTRGTPWRWTAYRATGCAPGLGVALLVVPGNEHAWPGGPRPYAFAPRPAPGVPLSDSLLAFFLAHPRS